MIFFILQLFLINTSHAQGCGGVGLSDNTNTSVQSSSLCTKLNKENSVIQIMDSSNKIIGSYSVFNQENNNIDPKLANFIASLPICEN